MIREYKEEIEKLKQMLTSFNQAGVNVSAMSAFMTGSSSNLTKDESSQKVSGTEATSTTSSALPIKEKDTSRSTDFPVLAAPCSEIDGSPRIQGNGNGSPRFSAAPLTNESGDSLNFAAMVATGESEA